MQDKKTFVDVTEEMLEVLAEDVDMYIDSVIEALMPDGRPFGMEKKSPAEELSDYMELRGNAMAWWEWMATRYDYIKTKMNEMLPPDKQALMHPWDIVFRYAMNFSAKMEKEYQKQQKKMLNQEPDYMEQSVDNFSKYMDYRYDDGENGELAWPL